MLLPPSVPIPDTLKGVDDLIRSNSEGFRNSCFNWLLVSTGVVVAGLLLELPEIYLESINAIRQLLHSGKPERHIPALVKLVVSVGWFLIVLGVAGEFVADSFVSKADGFVQKLDEILLADTQRKSGLANERAAMAFARAAQTEKEAAEDLKTTNIARQKAEEARQKAEGFQLQIASANERAAEASRIAEEERLARVQIELRLAPRALSPAQIDSIREQMRPFAGQHIDLITYPHEAEPTRLGNQISAALVPNLVVAAFQPLDPESAVGIIIEFDPKDANAGKAAKSLADILKNCGLVVSGPMPTLPRTYKIGYSGPSGVAPNATIRVTIGSK
jgi:hypothetical protein